MRTRSIIEARLTASRAISHCSRSRNAPGKSHRHASACRIAAARAPGHAIRTEASLIFSQVVIDVDGSASQCSPGTIQVIKNKGG